MFDFSKYENCILLQMEGVLFFKLIMYFGFSRQNNDGYSKSRQILSKYIKTARNEFQILDYTKFTPTSTLSIAFQNPQQSKRVFGNAGQMFWALTAAAGNMLRQKFSSMFVCSYTIIDYKLEQYFSLIPNQSAVNNPRSFMAC